MKKLLSITAVLMAMVLVVTSFAIAQEPVANPDNALGELYNKGLISGYQDGDLHPDYLLTRAQFARILSKAFPDESVHDAKHTFTDLPPSHWAYTDVQYAANAGWIKGYQDGSFRPDENILFEQAVTVICRVLRINNYNESYPDGSISTAIEYSITDGVNALIGEVINRQQAAQLVVNALDFAQEQSVEYSSATKSFYNAPMISAATGGGGGGGAPASVNYAADSSVTIEAREEFFAPPDMFNTEEYVAESENVFKDAVTSPLSTFSIDADTASYSNMRRFILNGQRIPDGSIRSEELINYFDYAKAETEEGKPFGVRYTVAQCPWNEENDLAMITISGEELSSPKPSNLVFLIDVSGSMSSYNKLPLVKKALSMMLDKLGEQDRISIVTYASHTGVALEPTPATEKETILNTLDNLMAGGSTNGASGINLAYEQAEKNKIDGNNRIILCTDGDFNVGISSTGDLEKLITEKRNSGIFLSVLGFGMGNYKDNRMETLADKGNGNYAYIDNLREAKKVLVDEMTQTIYTIAKDVKLQVEFNPEQVAQYRLVGYENRLLNNEDFDNDQKDAGELGAGATITALYEIVPQKGKVESSLKYQTTHSTGSDELMTVKIRYKLPQQDESILAEYPVKYDKISAPDVDFNFAAAVTELGMILNNSEYKGTSTLDSVIELAKASLGEDKFGLRNEFVQLVDLLRYRGR